jgi:hypothetical protein
MLHVVHLRIYPTSLTNIKNLIATGTVTVRFKTPLTQHKVSIDTPNTVPVHYSFTLDMKGLIAPDSVPVQSTYVQ